MKSYNDKRLLIGLLFIGIAGGFAGRFLETQKLSLPAASNLNQAAAILAVQENIVGTPSPEVEPTISLGFSVDPKASFAATPDISFSRAADCADDITIKAAKGRTVGLLCLSVKDTAIDAKIANASKQVNALVVSFDKKDASLAEQALAAGAVVVTERDAKILWLYTPKMQTSGALMTLNLTGTTVENVSAKK